MIYLHPVTIASLKTGKLQEGLFLNPSTSPTLPPRTFPGGLCTLLRLVTVLGRPALVHCYTMIVT